MSETPRTTAADRELYLIFSVEHDGWWATPSGYTPKLSQARRFYRAGAMRTCTAAIPGQASRRGVLQDFPVRLDDITTMQLEYHARFPQLPAESWE